MKTSVAQVGLDGRKLTTKPRTPHPKNLLAKSAAAAAAAARKSDGRPSCPASPLQPQLPWVADPAGRGAASQGDVQAASHAHGASLSEDGSGEPSCVADKHDQCTRSALQSSACAQTNG